MADDPFLAPDEIADAVRAHVSDGQPQPGQYYYAGLDLGVSKDWASLTVGHIDAQTRFVVDVVRFWRPTSTKRVSLHEVEQEIIRLESVSTPCAQGRRLADDCRCTRTASGGSAL